MPEISSSSFSETDASNNSTSPNGAPEGMMPSGVNDTIRAIMGAVKRFWDRINAKVTSAGTTPHYTLTPTVALAAYVSGEVFRFIADKDSAGSDDLNISGLGAKNLYKRTTAGIVAIAASDIKNGDIVTVTYNSALNSSAGGFQLESPALGGVGSGGTGRSTLTAHAVLLGEGTSAVNFAAPAGAGRLLIDQGAAADPAFTAVSGDATMAGSGALTVASIGGKAVSLGAAVTTTGAGAPTLAFPGTGRTYTFPNAAVTLLSTGGATLNANVNAPAGNTTATQKMQGLGSTFTLTPLFSTRICVTISGFMSNNVAGNISQVQLYYGTGSAPANGAAATGTTASQLINGHSEGAASACVPFSMTAVITGLSTGTAYWFDIGLTGSGAGSTSALNDMTCAAFEM